MKFFDWFFGTETVPRGSHPAARPNRSRRPRPPIEFVARGNGPAAGRFLKLSDGAPEVLTQTANSAVVAKEGPTPMVNIWEMEEEGRGACPVPWCRPGT